ncbi:MAG TPA: sodium:proton antiporter [Gammaproteobacteria bacterium]|nr:sodium:proton antiporter [Gammaproteobacteria bacterium]
MDLTVAIVAVLGAGMLAQWLAWRLKVPAILFLLIAGAIAGPVLGWLRPHEQFGDAAVESIIGLCVAIILFEGGLNLELHKLREAASGVRRLIYFGIPGSFVFGLLAAHFIGSLSWPVAIVFGAIIVVTGPTVVNPLLRHAMLNPRTASYLRWEGSVNDPIGALLGVLLVEFFVSYGGNIEGIGHAAASVGIAIGTALVLGAGLGYATGRVYERGWIPEYLKSPILLVLVLAAYAAADAAQNSAGLLTVTVMGIVMGNMGLTSIQEMRRFKEYISLLLIAVVFILLTAGLHTRSLDWIGWQAAGLLAVVIFLIRPVAVWLATLGAGVPFKDRLLIGWIAPRGIVAAATAGVFAPALARAGYGDGYALTPLIFTLIFATVILHGFSIGPLARFLGLAAAKRNRMLIVGASPWTIALAETLQGANVPLLLTDSAWHRLKPARLAGVPVFYGEILSEIAESSLQLNDIGTLLAATSNDAYNALVCTAFAAELGRSQIFQLPMYAADENDPKGVTRTLRGRVAFHEEALYEDLWRDYAKGWKFQKTRLTEAYDFEAYKGEADPDSIVLLVAAADGEVAVQSPQSPVTPKAGDTVISFVPPSAAAGRERDSKQAIVS